MIKIISRETFKQMIGYKDSPVDLSDQPYYFISINDTVGVANTQLIEKSDNTLILYFDDCESEMDIDVDGKIEKRLPLSNEDAKSLLSFIEKMNPDKDVYVHCSMGVSRSGAVGTFIFDYMKVMYGKGDWVRYSKANAQINPNRYVLNKLRSLV